jgi:hypothetical protein
MKSITLALLVATITITAAQAQSRFIGARKVPGDPYVSSGCGSSYAICKYRANWRGRYRSPEYQKAQQRISRNCNPATVWKDACR